MRKLPAVEDARAIMTQGLEWSAWRWLLERGRVREMADRATAALDRADQRVKSAWPEELKLAYAQLLAAEKKSKRKNGSNHGAEEPHFIAPEVWAIAQRVKQADDKAERCRLDAEDIFDEAERRISAAMARQGARKALETYDLRESAIRKAEAAVRQLTPETTPS